jgi:hypothetical protein
MQKKAKAKNPVAVALASRRMTEMTPEERSAVAKKGAAARWGNGKKKTKARKAGKASSKKLREKA